VRSDKADVEGGGDNAFSPSSRTKTRSRRAGKSTCVPVYLFGRYRGIRINGEERRMYQGWIGENRFYRSFDPQWSARRTKKLPDA